jgi:hypothetical protein
VVLDNTADAQWRPTYRRASVAGKETIDGYTMKDVVMLEGYQEVMERSRSSETSHAEVKHDEHAGHGPGMVPDFLRRLIVSIIL